MRNEGDLREALCSLERHAPDLDAVLTALPGDQQRRPAPRRWLRTASPIVVALGVVAAVVTPLSLSSLYKNEAHNGPAKTRTHNGPFKNWLHNGPLVPAGGNASARVFLQGAAAKLAATPAPAPRAYWRVTTVQGDLYAGGPNSRPYAVENHTDPITVWYSDQPNRQVLSVGSPLHTAEPATPAAGKAWLAAGSPALFAGDGHYPATLPPGQLWWGLQFYSVAKFQRLPATVDGLKAAIQSSLIEPVHQTGETFTEPLWIATNPDMAYTPGTAGYDRFVFAMCLDLLDHEPVTPQVKAAALRVMATLPEVRLGGQVTDPLGRAGSAIIMPRAFMISSTTVTGSDDSQLQVILSASGALLAEQWIATRLPAGTRAAPSSGAVPGPVKCPAGWAQAHVTTIGGTAKGRVIPQCSHSRQVTIKDKNGHNIQVSVGTPLKPGENPSDSFILLDQPALAVAPGTVTQYQALVSAEWTDAAPPPSAALSVSR